MKESLNSRKQQLVRDAIYNAAIELFSEKGFDETTVEEVAVAAGVSRRSFFRYYSSKDDLLAQSVVNYARVLTSTILKSSSSLEPLDIVQETVLAAIQFNQEQTNTRQIIEIATRSYSARQAYMSRMVEVEEGVSEAFAKRLKIKNPNTLKPRLLSGLTLMIMNISLASWYIGENKDLTAAAKQSYASLSEMLCSSGMPVVQNEAKPAAKKPAVAKSSVKTVKPAVRTSKK